MTPGARLQAAIEILDDIVDGRPAEQALTGWARRSRFAGSGDRAAIRDHVFDALRRKRSYAALGGALSGRGLILGSLRNAGVDPETIFNGSRHCPAVLSAPERSGARLPSTEAERLDIPDWLWPEFSDSLGNVATTTAAALQQRAPVWLRVNTGRGSVDSALEALARDNIICERHREVTTAVLVTDGARRIASSTAYRDGRIELQDAASQAVIQALSLESGMRVLDYCAGGGGKALAMAAHAGVEVFASDADPRRMRDIPVRAARAGVRINVLKPGEVSGAGPFDLVLTDVPCTGSGSWRRAPAGKWLLTPERLAEIVAIQATILDDAAKLTGARGQLAYVTCSVLNCENHAQVERFLARTPEWRRSISRSWQVDDNGDGFFLTLLTR